MRRKIVLFDMGNDMRDLLFGCTGVHDDHHKNNSFEATGDSHFVHSAMLRFAPQK
jgi:hypothetical protein